MQRPTYKVVIEDPYLKERHNLTVIADSFSDAEERIKRTIEYDNKWRDCVILSIEVSDILIIT